MGFLLFFVGCFLCGINFLKNYSFYVKEEKAIENFFEIKYDRKYDLPIISEETNHSKKENIVGFNYVAVLQIPKINLEKGLFAIHDKNNNVDKNIEILSQSDMPDVPNGNFILASHSGYSRISFFKNLDKLKLNDFVYVYYHGYKYCYKIIDTNDVKKTGSIDIFNNYKNSIVTLITCKRNTDMQIVMIAELVNKEEY